LKAIGSRTLTDLVGRTELEANVEGPKLVHGTRMQFFSKDDTANSAIFVCEG
jgi:hypothetical protein